MTEEMRGRGRSPEGPEKYVSLLDLKERWMKQHEDNREEERGEQGKVIAKLGDLKIELKEDVGFGVVEGRAGADARRRERRERVSRYLGGIRRDSKLGRPEAGGGVLNEDLELISGDVDLRERALDLDLKDLKMKPYQKSRSGPPLRGGDLQNGGGTEARVLEVAELERKGSGEGNGVLDCARKMKKKNTKKKRNQRKKLEMRMEAGEEVTEEQEKIEAIQPARENGDNREVVTEEMEKKGAMLSEEDNRRIVNRDGGRMKWQPRANQEKAVGGVDRSWEPVKREAVPVNGFSKWVVYQDGNGNVEHKQDIVKSLECYPVDLREKCENSVGTEWDSSSRYKFKGVRNKGSGKNRYGLGTGFEDEKKLGYVIVQQVKKEALGVSSDNPRMASLDELSRKSANVIMSHETVEPVYNHLIKNEERSGTPSVSEQPDGNNWFTERRNGVEGRKMYSGGLLETEKNVGVLNADKAKKEAILGNHNHPRKKHNPSVEIKRMTEPPTVAGKEANYHDRFRTFENRVEERKVCSGDRFRESRNVIDGRKLYSGGGFKSKSHLCSLNVGEVGKEVTHMTEDQLKKNDTVLIKAETIEPVVCRTVEIKEAIETPALPDREANGIDHVRARRTGVYARKIYCGGRLKVVRNGLMDPSKFVDKGNRMRRLENQSFSWVKKGEASSGNAGGKD